MTRPHILAFVQARMASRRFPGKVLAPLWGRPIIWHVLASVSVALPSVPVVVTTTSSPSDDPLVSYVSSLGAAVFRGPEDDVLERIRSAARAHPCDWILRLSADSPRLRGNVLQAVVDRADQRECDVVTTIFPRSFPRGQNAEALRATVLDDIDAAKLSAEDREHVTPYIYRHPEQFRIVNVGSGDPRLAKLSFAVDTLEDLERLERLAERGVGSVGLEAVVSRLR